jgi:hypothetical protein
LDHLVPSQWTTKNNSNEFSPTAQQSVVELQATPFRELSDPPPAALGADTIDHELPSHLSIKVNWESRLPTAQHCVVELHVIAKRALNSVAMFVGDVTKDHERPSHL